MNIIKRIKTYFCWHKPLSYKDGSRKGHFDGMSEWGECKKCGREICLTSQGWV